jgi:hypothetical protein
MARHERYRGWLTFMDAIWLYVAGPSRVRPMVRKNRDRRVNASARVASTRLLYAESASRMSLSFVTVRLSEPGRNRGVSCARTLLNHGMIELVDICTLDVLPAVALECGEAVADTTHAAMSSGLPDKRRARDPDLVTASRIGSSVYTQIGEPGHSTSSRAVHGPS